MKSLPFISIVVIGFNEEINLKTTFEAINRIDYPKDKYEVIYIDSGSKDRSVEIARQYTKNIFVECKPFPSAGRARNRGLLEAKHEIIHFIDGDVEINRDYLKKAIVILDNPAIHAVCGAKKERFNRGFNRILSSSWDNPKEGFTNTTAIGGTFKRSALLQINGYDERVLRGQETEMNERFGMAGFTIWSTINEMGVHNYEMKGIQSLFRLFFKDGQSKIRNMLITEKSKFFINNRKYSIKNIIHNLILILILLALIISRHIYLMIFLIILLLIAFLLKYLIFRRVFNLNKLIYLFIMNLSKPLVFMGQINELFKIYFNHKYILKIKQNKWKLLK